MHLHTFTTFLPLWAESRGLGVAVSVPESVISDGKYRVNKHMHVSMAPKTTDLPGSISLSPRFPSLLAPLSALLRSRTAREPWTTCATALMMTTWLARESRVSNKRWSTLSSSTDNILKEKKGIFFDFLRNFIANVLGNLGIFQRYLQMFFDFSNFPLKFPNLFCAVLCVVMDWIK